MRINITTSWIFALMCCVCAVISCGPSETNNQAATEEPHPSQKIVEVTYETATVYAGKTDYYFKTTNGVRIEIGISNMEGDKKTRTPDGLLEKGTEGPPVANPEKVGKPYQLVYEKGELIEIREK